MTQTNQTINQLFDKAKLGDPESQYLLIKEYLLDVDNPDSIERAYRLLLSSNYNNDESACTLARFHWGDYGKKYIDFVKCRSFLSKERGKCTKHIMSLIYSIKIDLGSADIEKKAKEGDNWAIWIMACRMYYKGEYKDSANWALKINDKELLHCATYLRGYIFEEWLRNIDEALSEYTRAAKYGSLAGMIKSACYYFGEHPQSGNLNFLNKNNAFIYGLQAAKNGHLQSMLDIGRCYRYGIGTPPDPLQAFKWLYKAAYLGCGDDWEGSVQEELAEIFVQNKLFKPNYAEAFAWMQSFNLKYSDTHLEPERKELSEKIYEKQSPKYKGKPNLLAEKYFNLYKVQGSLGPYTSDDLDPYLDYVFQKYTEDDYIFDATKDVANFLDGLTDKNITGDTTEIENIESIETTRNPVFEHLDKVSMRFDPNKLKIKLIADVTKNEKEASDFKYFVFSYGSLHDRKSVDVFATNDFKIHRRERQLLIRLAIQYSNKDTELSKQNIASVIKRHDLDPTIISCLNKMMLHVFPDCFKTTQSNMIDRKAGKLKIPIYFHDIWRIELCKDYDDLKRV